jgi:hypothetical protein
MVASNGLPAKKPAKPGELMLWAGIAAIVIAPIFLAVLVSYERQLTELAQTGVVTEGVVKNKDVQSSSTSNYRGKPRTSRTYLVNFAYDFNASTPYADWKKTGVLRPSAYPAMTTHDFQVGSDWYDRLEPGAKAMLIWRVGSYGEGMVVEEMEHRMSLGFRLSWYAPFVAAFFAGIGLTYAGWRKRTAHAAR